MTESKKPSKVESLPAPEAGRRVLIKGQQTKAVIIDAALGLASQIGLNLGKSLTQRPVTGNHAGTA